MSVSGAGSGVRFSRNGGPPDVGRLGLPGEAVAGRHRQAAPPVVALEDAGVLLAEHLGGDRAEHRLLNLALGRPDVLQVHRPPVGARAERLGGQVDVHRPGQRVGHHQRRRGEVVRAHVLLDAALEVAVAAQHRGNHQALLPHLGRDLLGQRAAVADAGRAPVADEVEAERVEKRLQPGLAQVLGHDLRAGRQAGLHPRLARQALLDRLLRQQARADHHAWIRRVGAAGDGGDHDRSMLEPGLDRHARRRRRPRRPS